MLQLVLLSVGSAGLVSGYFILDGATLLASKVENGVLIEGFVLIMWPAVLVGVANYMLGTAGLNNLNSKRLYATYLVITGFASLLICITLVYFLEHFGAAISFLLSEVLLLSFLLNSYFSQGKKISTNEVEKQ